MKYVVFRRAAKGFEWHPYIATDILSVSNDAAFKCMADGYEVCVILFSSSKYNHWFWSCLEYQRPERIATDRYGRI